MSTAELIVGALVVAVLLVLCIAVGAARLSKALRQADEDLD